MNLSHIRSVFDRTTATVFGDDSLQFDLYVSEILADLRGVYQSLIFRDQQVVLLHARPSGFDGRAWINSGQSGALRVVLRSRQDSYFGYTKTLFYSVDFSKPPIDQRLLCCETSTRVKTPIEHVDFPTSDEMKTINIRKGEGLSFLRQALNLQ